MITKALEDRFHFAKELKTEHGISLPMILPKEERIFTFSWIKNGDNKEIVIHDLYSLDLEKKTVSKTSIEEKGLHSNKIAEGVRGIAAFEIEEKYMVLYEEIREDYYVRSSSEKAQLKHYFDQLITDNALIEAYKKYGKEMFW